MSSFIPNNGTQSIKSTTNGNGTGPTSPVPVQQIYNGPSCSYISVFNTPGSYDININFRPQGPIKPVGETPHGNVSAQASQATLARQIKGPSAYPAGTQSSSQFPWSQILKK